MPVQEELISAFTLISTIFQSNLSFRVKNDSLCRTFALRYNLPAVSLFLYDGQKDTLVNRGSYINHKSLECISKNREDFINRHMLANISFYDFLYYKFYRTGIPAEITEEEAKQLVNDFKANNSLPFNYKFDLACLDEPGFVRNCHAHSISLATNGCLIDGYYKLHENSFYNLYKRKFTANEQYTIGPDSDSYTGRVFWLIISGKKKLPDYKAPFMFKNEIEIEEDRIHSMTQMDRLLVPGLETICGYKFTKALQYCAIPLWTNERCIGILRVLVNQKVLATLTKSPMKIKSIRHASEIAANFLNESYTNEFIDRIVHDTSSSTQLPVLNFGEANVCSNLRQAMNSFGCILRMSDYPGTRPRIVAHSTDSVAFSSFVKDILCDQQKDGFIIQNLFNKEILRCFSSTHSGEPTIVDNRYRLVGVALNISANSELYPTRYYYCHTKSRDYRGSERVHETDDLFIFKQRQRPSFETVIHPEARQILQNINGSYSESISIHHLLILDVPALMVDGIFTFANTKNHPFTLSDVRFAYGEMKRFGQESSRLQMQRLQNYTDISSTYFHDLKNIIKICIYQSQLIIGEGFSDKDALSAAQHLNDFLLVMKSKILNFQHLASLNRYPKINTTSDNRWLLADHLEKLSRILSVVGDRYKKTLVWFRYNLSEETKEVKINRDLIDLCYFNILENAMKDSYGKTSKEKVNGYDANDERTPGHVHVHLFENESDYIIEVQNWGLPLSDRDKIFEKNERTEDTTNFLRQENPEYPLKTKGALQKVKLWQKSTNAGLPAVQRFIGDLGGCCFCETRNGATVFTLTFKKKQPYDLGNRQKN